MPRHPSHGPGRGGAARGGSIWGGGWGGPPQGAGNGNLRVQNMPRERRRSVRAAAQLDQAPPFEVKIAMMRELVHLAENSPDAAVRMIAADRALDRLVGKPRKQRLANDLRSAPFVVFERDLAAAEPGLGHNGGPPIER